MLARCSVVQYSYGTVDNGKVLYVAVWSDTRTKSLVLNDEGDPTGGLQYSTLGEYEWVWITNLLKKEGYGQARSRGAGGSILFFLGDSGPGLPWDWVQCMADRRAAKVR